MTRNMTFAVGDTAFIRDGYSARKITEGKVTKVTPSGQITVTITAAHSTWDMRFMPDGIAIESGSKWYRSRLVSPEDAANARSEQADRERAIALRTKFEEGIKDCHPNRADFEALRKIHAEIGALLDGAA